MTLITTDGRIIDHRTEIIADTASLKAAFEAAERKLARFEADTTRASPHARRGHR